MYVVLVRGFFLWVTLPTYLLYIKVYVLPTLPALYLFWCYV